MPPVLGPSTFDLQTGDLPSSFSIGASAARRGFVLTEARAGNLHVREFPGFIVKESNWHWLERDPAGNAIDFCTQVLRLSFHDAMKELTGS